MSSRRTVEETKQDGIVGVGAVSRARAFAQRTRESAVYRRGRGLEGTVREWVCTGCELLTLWRRKGALTWYGLERAVSLGRSLGWQKSGRFPKCLAARRVGPRLTRQI